MSVLISFIFQELTAGLTSKEQSRLFIFLTSTVICNADRMHYYISQIKVCCGERRIPESIRQPDCMSRSRFKDFSLYSIAICCAGTMHSYISHIKVWQGGCCVKYRENVFINYFCYKQIKIAEVIALFKSILDADRRE